MTTKVTSDIELALERAKIKADKKLTHQLPEYFSGARAILTVNGQRIGAAMEVSYSVSVDHTELRTIDSSLPWELIPGQIKIKASLRRIISPDRSLAGDGLFTTITSSLHTPYSSIELRDRTGNIIFYAKGSFTEIQGSVQNGQLGVESVSFVGYYWKENVRQEFNPAGQGLGDRLKGVISQNSLVRRVFGG